MSRYGRYYNAINQKNIRLGVLTLIQGKRFFISLKFYYSNMKIELNAWERIESKAVHKMHSICENRRNTETLTDNLIGMKWSQLQYR